jgi:hypothetical protein
MNAKDLITEIRAAFDGVSREGGVSLHQCPVLDDHGTAEELAAAARLDTDRDWSEVPDEWIQDRSIGGLAFLDAVGWKYYLPAFMICSIRGWRDDASEVVTWVISNLNSFTPHAMHGDTRKQLASLDGAQRRAVAHFVRFVAELPPKVCWEAPNARLAYESFWKRFE